MIAPDTQVSVSLQTMLVLIGVVLGGGATVGHVMFRLSALEEKASQNAAIARQLTESNIKLSEIAGQLGVNVARIERRVEKMGHGVTQQ